jgi:uncharacterized membrane protein (UPF0127 family)
MQLLINKNIFNVKIVKNSESVRKGMMKKKFNSNFNGMLFVMGQGKHCFWMKNCIIPLDIIFIQDGKIIKIFHNCPPDSAPDPKTYCANGKYVLEVEGGTCKELNIKEGDPISKHSKA